MRHLMAGLTVAAGLLMGSASAGDRSALTQVVFTPDGSRVFTVVESEQDGSGFEYVTIKVLDTSTGRTLWSAGKPPMKDDPGLARREVNRYWPGVQRRFGFTAFKLSRPRYMLPLPPIIPLGPYGLRKLNVTLWSKPVPITVQTSETTGKCDYLPDPNDKLMKFKLQIGNQVLASGKLACATEYSVARVDVQGNRVLVALNAFTPGFEGPNNDQVLVAATLR